MKKTFYDFCRETGREGLLTQWDTASNGGLSPQTVSYGSRKKVWWICPKGHRWQAEISCRGGQGEGCPVCAGRQVAPGENDLATRLPAIAAQWHREKNGSLTPDQVMPGSHQKVWWQCEQGHEWQAIVKSRAEGCGCPVCANRKILPGVNDLVTACPGLAEEWHPTKNGALRPQTLAPGTRRKVWWQCAQGHQWQATVASRACNGSGCPVCAGKQVCPGENDLASVYPNLAAQWHPTKNAPLTPSAVTPSSNRSIWWRCDRGHQWRAPVSQRTRASTGCPYCSGRRVLAGFNDLGTLAPLVAAQWAEDLNGTLTPDQVTVGSSRRVWWRCQEGHTWKAKIYSRTGKQGAGCPVCAGVSSKRFAHRYQRAEQTEPGQ